MHTFFINPRFTRQLTVLTCAHAILIAGAAIVLGLPGLAIGLVSAAISLCLFTGSGVARHREIMALALSIDHVLHDGRTVSFSDCREGDLAVLKNVLDKMVARLHHTTEQLHAEKAALANALADISHQIRTPLTAIEIMIPIIERTDNEEQRASKLHNLERMIDRMSWLVSTLLKMAKLNAGALRLVKKRTGVLDVAKRAFEPLELALDLRDITYSISATGTETFEGDASWTAEALQNIVKNCMEHTPAGGSITLMVSEDALATRLSIVDTGPGISAADLPHLFERFYRGEAPTPARDHLPQTTSSQGFGIGLSLAQSLICAQGATLRAHNSPQGGACFEVAFPKVTL